MSDLEHNRRVSPGLLAAGALVALVAVALVVVLVARGLDRESGPTDPDPTRATSDSTCGLPPGDLTDLDEAPAAEWTLVGRIAAPQRDGVGPGEVTDGVNHCFARSTEGALFAAVYTIADTANPEADLVQALRLHYLESSPGFDQALQDAETAEPSASGGLQVAGFRIDSSTEAAVTLTLALQFAEGPQSGGLVSATFTLEWTGGDWRAYLPATGPSMNALSSLQGFVEWSGT